MVIAADGSPPPRAPHAAQCPFHPEGKHKEEDYYTLKKYIMEHAK